MSNGRINLNFMDSFDKTINRKKLITSNESDSFVKHIEKIYDDLVNTPQFNDEEVFFEETGIEFFYKETKEEMTWMLIVILRLFINQFGFKASHIIKNKDLLGHVLSREYDCLGINYHMMTNQFGIHKFIFTDESEKDPDV